MEEFYAEGLATHGGPESCVDDPQGRGEALTPGKARHGQAWTLTTCDLTSQRTS
jgi:hypothetical protein